MSLCGPCRKAFASMSARGHCSTSLPLYSALRLREPFSLHTSWESLVMSLNHDCPFCWTLWRYIRSSPIASSTNERITEFKAEITHSDYTPAIGLYWVEISLTGHGLETKDLHFSLSKTTEKCYQEAEREFPLAVQHTPESAAHVANRWIETCEANHPDCLGQAAPPEQAKMPARLLDLGDVNSKVWRIYQDPRHVPYAALSHRWSSDTPELHTSNCENYCSPQPDSALPQNYQDIISICRALPIQYLWIDSLCIIQDDNGDDFNKQAPLMMDIYQYAFLTLSICWDFQGSSIFRRCRPRSIPRPKPPTYHRDRDCVSDSDEWVFVEEQRLGDLRVHVSRAPINQRAWVLQERYLSRRLLYLGNDQLYWECDGSNGSETSPDHIYQQGRRQSIRDLTGRSNDNAWSQTLTEYTGSDLTFETDRLVAIAGLAKVIASKTDKTYFAGIWLDSWMQDLLWEPTIELERRPKLKQQELTMVPPSWSWLGFSGSVDSGIIMCGEGPRISTVSPNSFKSDEYQPLALLSEALVYPPQSDPFASFEQAILKIRCLLLPVTFAGLPHRDKKPSFFRHENNIELSSVGLDCFRLQACEPDSGIYEPYGDRYITLRFTFSKPLDMSLQYSLVPLYRRQEPWVSSLPSCVYGLVLQKGLRESNEEYTRVGMWFEDFRFSQLSPIISNTIIRLGIGKNPTLSEGSLPEDELVFDSKLHEYAAVHVASKVHFPMAVVKKIMEPQPYRGPFIREEEAECSLLPHFTRAEWGTISLV